MAAARVLNVEVRPAHWSKQDAAKQLAENHGLPTIADLMLQLNDTRKASNYGDIDAPDLDAEDVAIAIEQYLDAVDAIIMDPEDEDD